MKTTNRNQSAIALAIALGTMSLVGCSKDGGTAPQSTAVADVFSSFEEGTDGWRGSGDYEDLRTSRTRPVQGYYLMAGDRAEGGTWYFLAPAKFTGDKSAYYGGSLSYYILAGLQSGATPTANDYFGAPDIVITGADMTLEFSLPRSAYPDPNSFRALSISLQTGPQWRVRGGDVANADQMRAVLADVQALYIRGEYFNGDDYGKIDEVYLEGQQ